MAVPTTEFTSRQTTIPGLLYFEVSEVGDHRGYFQEKYHRQKLIDAGLPAGFLVVQNSLSYNQQKGVTRGYHAEPWDKYITIITGSVFCSYVDLRAGDGFGRTDTIELTKNQAVYLPRGVANSFQTLEDDTYYLYSVNDHWSGDKYDQYVFVNLADPDLSVDWPVPLDQAIMSDRDRSHPALKDITPMEV